ncbi:hypothetical protein FA15DRAFT_716348 [Coprinopsis marcescibilis]|uniref:F-box domain-containing protein n=1 Tax=Coprinopsis marcescibilis TaxID=230819 RepID=A0A5C3KME2_COPMA|nr:hypothetical protein FA15DRAFT_716348 [Coprinopsis marcescibilis]
MYPEQPVGVERQEVIQDAYPGSSQSPSTMTARNRELEQMDARIVSMRRDIFELTSQRNARSITYQLPTETLSKIFIECRNLPPRNIVLAGNFRWFKLSHVSRHWRAIAVGCAQLWSAIDDSCLPLAHVMLERSKRLPLAIEINGYLSPPYTEDDFCDVMTAALPRLESFKIRIGARTLKRRLASLCMDATPELRSLSIHNDTSYEQIALPSNIFKRKTPYLRHLNLYNCHILWKSPLLSGLTFLKMYSPVRSAPKQTFEDFIKAFSRMPHLTHLDLDVLFPDTTGYSADEGEFGISLPCLEQLVLTGTFEECGGFLKWVRMPASASLRLNCTPAPSNLPIIELAKALSWNTHSLSGEISSRSAISALRIYQPSSNTTIVQTWAESISFTASVPEMASPSLQISFPGSGAKANFHLQHILQNLPLDCLASLDLSCPIGRDGLRHIAGLPMLESMHLRGTAVARHNLSSLDKDIVQSRFGRLLSVSISEVNLDEAVVDLVGFCVNMLMRDEDNNTAIGRLQIVNCYNIPSKTFKIFQHFVDVFEWDGVEGVGPEEDTDSDEE